MFVLRKIDTTNHDKTHWVSPNPPKDSRIGLGALWSKSSTGELYICTAVNPVVFTLLVGAGR